MMTPDDRIAAAELALGLAEGEERVDALERLLVDPAFADEVAWWRAKVAPLMGDYAEGAPSPAVLARIEALLQARPDEDEQPVVVALPASPPPSPSRVGWFAGGAGLGAIAATIAALLLTPRAEVPATPSPSMQPAALLLAPLTPPTASETALAVVDLKTHQIRVLGTIAAPGGHDAQLWRIGADKVPHPVGVLPRGRRSEFILRNTDLDSGAVLAVSIEPVGGSPTGKPTGPIVATGTLVSS